MEVELWYRGRVCEVRCGSSAVDGESFVCVVGRLRFGAVAAAVRFSASSRCCCGKENRVRFMVCAWCRGWDVRSVAGHGARCRPQIVEQK